MWKFGGRFLHIFLCCWTAFVGKNMSPPLILHQNFPFIDPSSNISLRSHLLLDHKYLKWKEIKSQLMLCCLEQSRSLPTLFAKSSQNTTEQQQHFHTLSSFLTLPVKCNLTVVYWLGFVEQQDNRSMVWKEKADEWSSPSRVSFLLPTWWCPASLCGLLFGQADEHECSILDFICFIQFQPFLFTPFLYLLVFSLVYLHSLQKDNCVR